jgi:hypothetical protein
MRDYYDYPALTFPQASLLADVLHAAGRNEPTAWLTGPVVTYGNLVSVTGAKDTDIRDCYVTIKVTGTRKVKLSADNAARMWAGDLQPAAAREAHLTVSSILHMMADGLFVICPATEIADYKERWRQEAQRGATHEEEEEPRP